MFPNGEEVPDRGPRGQRLVDASFLLLFNGGTEPALFTLPATPGPREYELVADTGPAYVRPPGPTPPATWRENSFP